MSDAGEGESAVADEELSPPYVTLDGRTDFNYPVGLLELHDTLSIQVIFISLLEGKTLVALPQTAWHRLKAQRILPPQGLSKATLAEVAVAEPDDRMALLEQDTMKVWLGFLRTDLVDQVRFPEEDEEADEHTHTFSPDGVLGLYPAAQALVDVAHEHFAFFTAEGEPAAPQEGSGSQLLDARVDKLEESLAVISKNLQTLLARDGLWTGCVGETLIARQDVAKPIACISITPNIEQE